MYHDKPFLSRLRLLRRVLLVLLAAALVAVACAWGAGRIGADLSGQGADALKNAVLRSAVQCYAVEGYYPRKPGLSDRPLRPADQPRPLYRGV